MRSVKENKKAKYIEALVTNTETNHKKTLEYLESDKLFPLEEMMTFNIGRTGLKTNVGYPASGSFIAYIAEFYGLAKLKELHVLEGRKLEIKTKNNSMEIAFGKTVTQLEKEWLHWLKNR